MTDWLDDLVAGAEALLTVEAEDICDWAEREFILPETKRPIKLEPFQRRILRDCFTPDAEGRVPYTTVIYSSPKKSGKTAIGALAALWWADNQEASNEIYIVANDFDQAKSRVFGAIDGVVRSNPVLASRTKLTASQLQYQDNRTRIEAIARDWAGAAGSNHGLTVWDELWAYMHEASLRLWDELTPVPTRRNSIRFVATYAGYLNESKLLEDLYKRGLAGRRLYEDGYMVDGVWYDDPLPVYVNGSLYMYWDHRARMPWQTPQYYKTQRTELRPSAYRRLHGNEWVTKSETFVPMDLWDLLEDPTLRPLRPGDRRYPIVLGADASKSRDCTALVACYYDPRENVVYLKWYRIWTPAEIGKGKRTIDLDETIGTEIWRIHQEHKLLACYYDPYQLHSIATRLTKDGVSMVEFPQTTMRVKSDQNLFDLINQSRLRTYKCPDLRQHIANAVAKATPRGYRLDKDATTMPIDGAVALAMAAYGAMEEYKNQVTRGPLPRRVFIGARWGK